MKFLFKHGGFPHGYSREHIVEAMTLEDLRDLSLGGKFELDFVAFFDQDTHIQYDGTINVLWPTSDDEGT